MKLLFLLLAIFVSLFTSVDAIPPLGDGQDVAFLLLPVFAVGMFVVGNIASMRLGRQHDAPPADIPDPLKHVTTSLSEPQSPPLKITVNDLNSCPLVTQLSPNPPSPDCSLSMAPDFDSDFTSQEPPLIHNEPWFDNVQKSGYSKIFRGLLQPVAAIASFANTAIATLLDSEYAKTALLVSGVLLIVAFNIMRLSEHAFAAAISGLNSTFRVFCLAIKDALFFSYPHLITAYHWWLDYRQSRVDDLRRESREWSKWLADVWGPHYEKYKDIKVKHVYLNRQDRKTIDDVKDRFKILSLNYGIDIQRLEQKIPENTDIRIDNVLAMIKAYERTTSAQSAYDKKTRDMVYQLTDRFEKRRTKEENIIEQGILRAAKWMFHDWAADQQKPTQVQVSVPAINADVKTSRKLSVVSGEPSVPVTTPSVPAVSVLPHLVLAPGPAVPAVDSTLQLQPESVQPVDSYPEAAPTEAPAAPAELSSPKPVDPQPANPVAFARSSQIITSVKADSKREGLEKKVADAKTEVTESAEVEVEAPKAVKDEIKIIEAATIEKPVIEPAQIETEVDKQAEVQAEVTKLPGGGSEAIESAEPEVEVVKPVEAATELVAPAEAEFQGNDTIQVKPEATESVQAQADAIMPVETATALVQSAEVESQAVHPVEIKPAVTKSPDTATAPSESAEATLRTAKRSSKTKPSLFIERRLPAARPKTGYKKPKSTTLNTAEPGAQKTTAPGLLASLIPGPPTGPAVPTTASVATNAPYSNDPGAVSVLAGLAPVLGPISFTTPASSTPSVTASSPTVSTPTAGDNESSSQNPSVQAKPPVPITKNASFTQAEASNKPSEHYTEISYSVVPPSNLATALPQIQEAEVGFQGRRSLPSFSFQSIAQSFQSEKSEPATSFGVETATTAVSQASTAADHVYRDMSMSEPPLPQSPSQLEPSVPHPPSFPVEEPADTDMSMSEPSKAPFVSQPEVSTIVPIAPTTDEPMDMDMSMSEPPAQLAFRADSHTSQPVISSGNQPADTPVSMSKSPSPAQLATYYSSLTSMPVVSSTNQPADTNVSMSEPSAAPSQTKSFVFGHQSSKQQPTSVQLPKPVEQHGILKMQPSFKSNFQSNNTIALQSQRLQPMAQDSQSNQQQRVNPGVIASAVRMPAEDEHRRYAQYLFDRSFPLGFVQAKQIEPKQKRLRRLARALVNSLTRQYPNLVLTATDSNKTPDLDKVAQTERPKASRYPDMAPGDSEYVQELSLWAGKQISGMYLGVLVDQKFCRVFAPLPLPQGSDIVWIGVNSLQNLSDAFYIRSVYPAIPKTRRGSEYTAEQRFEHMLGKRAVVIPNQAEGRQNALTALMDSLEAQHMEYDGLPLPTAEALESICDDLGFEKENYMTMKNLYDVVIIWGRLWGGKDNLVYLGSTPTGAAQDARFEISNEIFEPELRWIVWVGENQGQFAGLRKQDIKDRQIRTARSRKKQPQHQEAQQPPFSNELSGHHPTYPDGFGGGDTQMRGNVSQDDSNSARKTSIRLHVGRKAAEEGRSFTPARLPTSSDQSYQSDAGRATTATPLSIPSAIPGLTLLSNPQQQAGPTNEQREAPRSPESIVSDADEDDDNLDSKPHVRAHTRPPHAFQSQTRSNIFMPLSTLSFSPRQPQPLHIQPVQPGTPQPARPLQDASPTGSAHSSISSTFDDIEFEDVNIEPPTDPNVPGPAARENQTTTLNFGPQPASTSGSQSTHTATAPIVSDAAAPSSFTSLHNSEQPSLPQDLSGPASDFSLGGPTTFNSNLASHESPATQSVSYASCWRSVDEVPNEDAKYLEELMASPSPPQSPNHLQREENDAHLSLTEPDTTANVASGEQQNSETALPNYQELQGSEDAEAPQGSATVANEEVNHQAEQLGLNNVAGDDDAMSTGTYDANDNICFDSSDDDGEGDMDQIEDSALRKEPRRKVIPRDQFRPKKPKSRLNDPSIARLANQILADMNMGPSTTAGENWESDDLDDIDTEDERGDHGGAETGKRGRMNLFPNLGNHNNNIQPDVQMQGSVRERTSATRDLDARELGILAEIQQDLRQEAAREEEKRALHAALDIQQEQMQAGQLGMHQARQPQTNIVEEFDPEVFWAQQQPAEQPPPPTVSPEMQQKWDTVLAGLREHYPNQGNNVDDSSNTTSNAQTVPTQGQAVSSDVVNEDDDFDGLEQDVADYE